MNFQEARQSSFAFTAEQSSALDRSDPGNSHPARLTEWTPERWAVAEDWRPVLDQFLAGEAAHKLACFMRERLQSGAIIYPAQPFRALALTPLAQVKVVILGQDPYHQPGQAEGLAFSVAPGVKPPPSLRNIFKEIARDPLLEGEKSREPRDGSLVRWASQGVLLLNTCLTVEEGQPASHAQRGWEVLTDAIVKVLARQKHPTAFLLWGAHAQAKQSLIVASDARSEGVRPVQQVLTANHPSPLSALRSPRPFIGCGHFGLVNEFLKQHESAPIAW